jgi:hypothetical protein
LTESNRLCHGPRKVISFCILAIICPAVFISVPLLMRFVFYGSSDYHVNPSDTRIIDDKISTIWCKASQLKLKSLFRFLTHLHLLVFSAFVLRLETRDTRREFVLIILHKLYLYRELFTIFCTLYSVCFWSMLCGHWLFSFLAQSQNPKTENWISTWRFFVMYAACHEFNVIYNLYISEADDSW